MKNSVTKWIFSCIFSGIAIASSLVTLGNPRKVSVDPTQKLDGDGSSKTRKNRKVVAATQPTDL